MVNTDNYIPVCDLGFTREQTKDIVRDRWDEFCQWMDGQTYALCDGWRYNHDERRYEPSPCGDSHGPVFYPWDVQRFLDGLPVID